LVKTWCQAGRDRNSRCTARSCWVETGFLVKILVKPDLH
jgi:hypothetical protein